MFVEMGGQIDAVSVPMKAKVAARGWLCPRVPVSVQLRAVQ